MTKRELKLLKVVAEQPQITATELAMATDTSPSYTSRALNSLKRKGLVAEQKTGTTKIIRFADTHHASLLRQLILEYSHMNLSYITNTGIKILTVINCLNLTTWDEIQQEAKVSFYALRPKMKQFTEMGLVEKVKVYTIHLRFNLISEFLKAFQAYSHQKQAQHYASDAMVRWCCGDKFLLETEKRLNLPATGITAFPQYGAQFITAKNLYLRAGNDQPLTLEDHLINHVLSEKTSNIMPLLITWRLNQDSIDKDKLKSTAYRLRADETINAVMEYLDTAGEKRALFLPDWDEFTDKYREYKHD